MAKKIGDIVIFHQRVYGPKYRPYYDAYKGHKFQVVSLHEGGHVGLVCVGGNVEVDGCVHDDDLIVVG